MRKHIIEQLRALEKSRHIKILYAIESGSRAWGFASENSDWDVRFIYVHTLDWYLQIGTRKDTIEKMLPNDLDLSGWELRKALGLFRKSNPSLLEWLDSPIVYIENEAIMKEWRALVPLFFNAKNIMYHYLNIARNTYNNYLKQDEVTLKKYFYALRPLACCHWIKTNGTMPPVLFAEMLDGFDETTIRPIVDQLLIDKKSAKELGKRPQIVVLNEYIVNEIEYYSEFLKDFQVEKNREVEILNDFFRKVIKHQ
ncbi:MAG: nucleotidyltransferase domain-containing protein [Saprospiraceae bacterium]